MSWSAFVKSSLNDLRSGSEVPDYFGCLSHVLARSEPANWVEIETDQAPVEVHEERRPEPEPEQEPEREPEQEPEPEPEEEEVMSDIPHEDIQSIDSPIQKTRQRSSVQYVSQVSDSEPVVTESEATFMRSREAVTEVEPEVVEEEEISEAKPQKSFADEFRSLGDGVYERYWKPFSENVPQLTKESKMMTSFRPSRYSRIKKAMQAKFEGKEQEPGSKLLFRRVET